MALAQCFFEKENLALVLIKVCNEATASLLFRLTVNLFLVTAPLQNTPR